MATHSSIRAWRIPMDRRAWQATVHGVSESAATEQLSSKKQLQQEKSKTCDISPPRGRWRRRRWHPTPVLLPGESQGWRSLVGCSPWDREESDTTERLHFHFSFSCIGEGNGNPPSVLAWGIPGTGEPGGLPSMGSHRVGHDWNDLAAAAGENDRMWSTGEGNGKPLQYSCLENPMNRMKRQNDRLLKEELPRSVGAQYATGDQWRNSSRKNEGMEPKQKCIYVYAN